MRVDIEAVPFSSHTVTPERGTRIKMQNFRKADFFQKKSNSQTNKSPYTFHWISQLFKKCHPQTLKNMKYLLPLLRKKPNHTYHQRILKYIPSSRNCRRRWSRLSSSTINDEEANGSNIGCHVCSKWKCSKDWSHTLKKKQSER